VYTKVYTNVYVKFTHIFTHMFTHMYTHMFTQKFTHMFTKSKMFNPMRLRGDPIGPPPTAIQKFALILLKKHYR
jgi:hypothetical protein